ncbi:hypothetical protein DQW50_16165 [Halorubrum sp. 48-1-W]|uniref:hypothetical protein n=1 Tax=Halorubrum sp. 48-1-W TaxID=2249761 RepID=UPI000DCDD1D1|nr:hypothetical protein [Halorubrum sp. 48-1-W]RAW44060.1 hypothetical protein DQW50_16165 [Halorubrum sp. 48-1-W]
MSADESELEEEEDGSTRLRDRARSAFQEQRQQASEGSTRLRDRATTAFQQRRQQAQRAREAIAEQRDVFAGALELDAGNIEPIQLDQRGSEFGFVPDETGRDELAMDFAADRPFVEPADTLVDADPREGVQTRTDPDATDEIAARARSETAADTDFIQGRDLDVEVGPGGVSGIEVADDRRDDVADRTRQELAEDDEFAEPGDFSADVSAQGIERAGLSDQGARRRAGRQFAAETPLREAGPDDVTATDDGFTLDAEAQRRVAARQFEADLEPFGAGELDPSSDIRETGDGFGLAEGPTREVAADQLSDQVGDTVDPADVELEPSDGGFEATFERRRR